MAFEIGKPRPENSGRKPGSLNKKNQEIADYANEKGVSPAHFLINVIAKDNESIDWDSISKEDQQWAIELLMPYMYGKRKPVDTNGDDSNDVLSVIMGAIDGTK